VKVIIYTPTYWKSPGTQYRVDMLLSSLKAFGINAELIIDNESILRSLYRYLSNVLLDKKKIWHIIGKNITDKVMRQRPDYVILVHDVTACASQYLAKAGIRAIVSIEDLTTRYVASLRKNPEKSKRINDILCECLQETWKVITPAYTLTEHIKSLCNVDSTTVLPGLKPYVELETALQRQPPIKIAHVRWLKHPINYIELNNYINYKKDVIFLLHNIGSAQNIKAPNVIKYRFNTPDEATTFLSQAHYGLIIELSDHFTLSTFYYHMALLQPIIGKLSATLQRETTYLEIPIYSDVVDHYENEIRALANLRKRYEIPQVHQILLKWL